MEVKSKVVHTPSSLQKSRHVCVNEGCSSYNYYRQAEKISIIKDIEDYLIRHYQSLFIIKTKNDKRSKLMKYWLRISYILFKSGRVGCYKNSEGQPIFGYMWNTFYNVVGDVVKTELRPNIYGSYVIEDNIFTFSWDTIKDSFVYIELPRKKGLLSQYWNLIKNCDDGFDNIRIDQDNNMIKYYLDAGTLNEGDQLRVVTSPSVNNMGIAVVTREFIPNSDKNKEEVKNNDKNSEIKQMLLQGQSTGLQPNQYQNNTQLAWLNFQNAWKFLCLNSGVRENRDFKKANITNPEVQNDNFSYEIAENYILQILQEFIDNWNDIFNEENYIEKTVEINYNVQNSSSNFINNLTDDLGE